MEKEEKEGLIRVEKSGNRSLLARYDIPVEHLSYEYISECTSAKTLERIVAILRSGEEGFYPDLTRHAEERLAAVKPTSIVLRKAEPVYSRSTLQPRERKEIENDINTWMREMQFRERDLNEKKDTLANDSFPRPDIRQFKEQTAKIKSVSSTKDSKQSKRINSCDYAAWDKYDVDTELNKIEIQEEQERVQTKRSQQRQNEITEKVAKDVTLNKSSLTGTELDVMAEHEREKGNEAFRAGDYADALEHYNSSIQISSNPVTFNNRAMTFIKLGRYEDALNDCNLVISTEYRNVKAILRRAVSLEHLEKLPQALADYEAVLKLEPTNEIAIKGVRKLRKPSESRKVRMIIEEKEEKDEEFKSNRIEANDNRKEEPKRILQTGNSICFCDRAPGPSQNLKPRPHLKAEYCLENENRRKVVTRDDNTSVVKFFSQNRKSKTDSRELHKNPTLLSPTVNNTSRKSNLTGKSKSIFSYTMPPAPVSSVIIEELTSEPCDNNSTVIKNKFNETTTTKKDSKAKNKDTNNLCNSDKVTASDIKKTNNVQSRIINSNEQRESRAQNPRKILVADKYERMTREKTMNNADNPYEFIRQWQSLKDDNDLKMHAQLLRSLNTGNLNAVIGNKLDGTMLSTILRCLERHFCTSGDTHLLETFLKSFSQVNRFSIVSMFMDTEDKRAVKRILNFLEEQGVSGISQLRKVYSA